MFPALNFPEWLPRPGVLVQATMMQPHVLEPDKAHKVGIVIGILPPYVGHRYAVRQWAVAWTGPGADEFITIEPDHRIKEVVGPTGHRQ